MSNQNKAKQQLLEDVVELRQRVAVLKGVDAERRPAAEASRENETRFRGLFRDSVIGMEVVAPNGELVDANRAYCDFLGYSEQELTGKKVHAVTHPEDREITSRVMRQGLISGPRLLRFEKRYLHKSGQVLWGEVRSTLVCDAKGNPSHFIGQVLDIGKRKRAEEALKRALDELGKRVRERTEELTKTNEELAIFRKFAESSGDGFGMYDFDGRIVYANPSLCRLLGEKSLEDVLGKSVCAYYAEQYEQRRQKEIIPALLQNGCWHSEQTVLPRHGKPIETLQSNFLILDEDGNPFRIAVVITDITTRRQAENELRQSHDELRAIYDAMVDGLLITDIETLQFVRANASICRMLGYSEAELRSLSVRDIHPAEALPHIVERIRSVEEADHTPARDIPILRKNGSLFYVEVIGKFLVYDGRLCSMGIFRDVTERHRQEALERDRQNLWHMLQASNQERQFISHEIHDGLAQHLAAAGMQLQVHDALKENSPDEAKKAYETALKLLRQAHVESRRLISEVRPPVMDNNGLETAISHLVHKLRRRGGPKVEFDSGVQFDRLPPFLENAIYRIVQEALTNACKHSKGKKVTVTMTQEGQDVRLEVRDWGIGFNPNSLGKGHLGLEGIRQRVRLLGGRLSIESTPGSGTLVQVVVPILEMGRPRFLL
jgi:PAS domain S-box-containing protein